MVAASSAGDPIWMGRMARLYPISIGKPTYRHCEQASGRSPRMKRAIRLSIHSGRLSREERLHYFSFSVRKLPLDCFGTSLLARSEAAGGRSQRWRNKGALQGFFQASPKLACFAPSFSKQIFGGFVGFQWVTSFPNALDAFQIFRLRPPAFGRILLDFTMQFSRQRFHRGAATQIERILNLTDNP